MEEKPLEEKPKRKRSSWNDRRSKTMPKPLPKSDQGEITTYFLSPEELEYFRNLKPPIQDKFVRTTAPRGNRYTKHHGQK